MPATTVGTSANPAVGLTVRERQKCILERPFNTYKAKPQLFQNGQNILPRLAAIEFRRALIKKARYTLKTYVISGGDLEAHQSACNQLSVS